MRIIVKNKNLLNWYKSQNPKDEVILEEDLLKPTAVQTTQTIQPQANPEPVVEQPKLGENKPKFLIKEKNDNKI